MEFLRRECDLAEKVRDIRPSIVMLAALGLGVVSVQRFSHNQTSINRIVSDFSDYILSYVIRLCRDFTTIKPLHSAAHSLHNIR